MGNKPSFMLQDEEIKLINEKTGFSPAQIERLYERFKSLDKSGICGSLSREDFLRVPELAINPLCDRIVHMFFVDCDDDHDRINFRQFIDVLATFSASNKPTRSRQISRQESIQNILNDLSETRPFLHSRKSSYSGCDDFIKYQLVQHHTTNQHSIHYVASTPQLAQHTVTTYANSVSREKRIRFMFKIYDVDNDDRISLEDLKQVLRTMVGNYIGDSQLTGVALKTLKKVDKNGDGLIDFDEFCTAFLERDIDELLKVKFATSHNHNHNQIK